MRERYVEREFEEKQKKLLKTIWCCNGESRDTAGWERQLSEINNIGLLTVW